MNEKLKALLPTTITVTPDVPTEYAGLRITVKLPTITAAKELLEEFKAITLTTDPAFLEFFKSQTVSIELSGETFVDDFWEDGHIRTAIQDTVINNLIAVATVSAK